MVCQLYRQSGGLPEYCLKYGENFDNDIESALKKLVKNYDLYVKNLETYPFNSDSMCQEFVDLFTELTDKEIISKKEPISKFSSFAFRSEKIIRCLLFFNKR